MAGRGCELPSSAQATSSDEVVAVFADDALDGLQRTGAARVVTRNTIEHGTNAIDLTDTLAKGVQRLLGDSRRRQRNSGDPNMNIKRITAIVPIDILPTMEKSLRACGVPGVTVEHVQGYGEHPNFFRRDLMHDNARLVLYAGDETVDAIIGAIGQCARECGAQAGMLAVESIDRLVNLTNGDEVLAASLTE